MFEFNGYSLSTTKSMVFSPVFFHLKNLLSAIVVVTLSKTPFAQILFISTIEVSWLVFICCLKSNTFTLSGILTTLFTLMYIATRAAATMIGNDDIKQDVVGMLSAGVLVGKLIVDVYFVSKNLGKQKLCNKVLQQTQADRKRDIRRMESLEPNLITARADNTQNADDSVAFRSSRRDLM